MYVINEDLSSSDGYSSGFVLHANFVPKSVHVPVCMCNVCFCCWLEALEKSISIDTTQANASSKNAQK